MRDTALGYLADSFIMFPTFDSQIKLNDKLNGSVQFGVFFRVRILMMPHVFEGELFIDKLHFSCIMGQT